VRLSRQCFRFNSKYTERFLNHRAYNREDLLNEFVSRASLVILFFLPHVYLLSFTGHTVLLHALSFQQTRLECCIDQRVHVTFVCRLNLIAALHALTCKSPTVVSTLSRNSRMNRTLRVVIPRICRRIQLNCRKRMR